MAIILFCLKCGASDLMIISWETEYSCITKCNHCNGLSLLNNFTVNSVYLEEEHCEQLKNQSSYAGKISGSSPPWDRQAVENIIMPVLDQDKIDKQFIEILNSLPICATHQKSFNIKKIKIKSENNWKTFLTVPFICCENQQKLSKKILENAIKDLHLEENYKITK